MPSGVAQPRGFSESTQHLRRVVGTDTWSDLSAYFPVSLEGFSVGKLVTIEVRQIPLQEENTNKPPDLKDLPVFFSPRECT